MELFKLYFDEKYNLILLLHWSIYVLIVVIIAFFLFRISKKILLFQENIEIDGAEIGIKGLKAKIKPNYMNIDIAYKIWVELNTRKIGLAIDFENDVIIEIYKSWYQFFGITRNLIKELPATKIRASKDSQELIEISIKILNEGLRPHLTLWQAKFHKWHDVEINKDENKHKSPQQLQKEFPTYDLLEQDMKKINTHLISYKKVLYKLAFGK